MSATPLTGSPRQQYFDQSQANGTIARVESDGDISSRRSSSGNLFEPNFVPPEHDRRTLVLCFDGTGDQFDADNSNIVQFFSMLRKDNPQQQLVYYQAGIGTYTIPQIATPAASRISKLVDEAIAKDLDAHVMGGYEFLMQNYRAYDKICIFGFSRGAYTARALAGMIHKVGLLPACNHQQVPFAYKMFSRDDDEGWRQSTAFKKAFSNDVEIEFLGVWDTVDSVGLIPRHLPFTQANNAIRYFRHALSLDERRAKFRATYWQPWHGKRRGTKGGEMPVSNQTGAPIVHEHHAVHHPRTSTGPEHAHGRKARDEYLEHRYDIMNRNWATDVLEVWFAGDHCDVGGGNVKNGTRHCLARIPLRWMIRQCFLAGTGIQFHRSSFAGVGIDPKNLYPVVIPPKEPIAPTPELVQHANIDAEIDQKTEREEEEEIRDALCPASDALASTLAWWILEVIPLKMRVQLRNSLRWTARYMINLGHPRSVPMSNDEHQIVRVHRSVRLREQAEGLKQGKYKPRAIFPFSKDGTKVEPTWVD
ncbi:hypothetical protein K488DRAFT_56207 [Vararia minispora EC-137]|uniref:Uncharacterized protein n=1 Tax=Vararia minispora EC-137 TaxID=1314806 RepID=A0ACB8QDX1_9AGAM|nr:hypothetical protein K488DRAFT_56207 [Vararia minispora EC-137]